MGLGLRAGIPPLASASSHGRTARPVAVTPCAQDSQLRHKVDGAITRLDAVDHAAKARYNEEVPVLQMELGTNNERIRQ